MQCGLFVIRRLLFIATLVFIVSPLIQVIVLEITNFSIIMVYILVRPYKEHLLNVFTIGKA